MGESGLTTTVVTVVVVVTVAVAEETFAVAQSQTEEEETAGDPEPETIGMNIISLKKLLFKITLKERYRQTVFRRF